VAQLFLMTTFASPPQGEGVKESETHQGRINPRRKQNTLPPHQTINDMELLYTG
jgi:hypothetical protein